MLQGSKKSGGKNGFGIVFLALHELLAHDGFTIFLGSGYGMVLAQDGRARAWSIFGMTWWNFLRDIFEAESANLSAGSWELSDGGTWSR
jgi:hypothetical protein